MKRYLKGDLLLLVVTISWGISFILIKKVLDILPTYSFLAIRFFIAFTISSLVFYKNMIKINKNTIKYGAMIGFILFLGFTLQTLGLNYTTASKSAFITGFSVVLVPIISSIFLKKIPKKSAILGVIMALVGLGFLTLKGKFVLNIGDLYTLISAFFFAIHIIIVGKYTVTVDSISLAIIQIGMVGILSFIMSLIFEKPVVPSEINVWTNILILSLACTSGAYIIQNVAQKYTTPTHTALIYTGEPVFAAIFAYVISGEVLDYKGMFGAVLVLIGMIIAEVDF